MAKYRGIVGSDAIVGPKAPVAGPEWSMAVRCCDHTHRGCAAGIALGDKGWCNASFGRVGRVGKDAAEDEPAGKQP